MACVVHYDLLGWFQTYPYYGKRAYVADNPQVHHEPELELEHIWIPRPGTDPTVSFSLRPTTIVMEDYDIDDFWTEVDDMTDDYDGTVNIEVGAVDTSCSVKSDNAEQGGTCSVRGDTGANVVHRQSPGEHIVQSSYLSQPKNGGDDGDGDDNDYVAPGEERDNDVF